MAPPVQLPPPAQIVADNGPAVQTARPNLPMRRLLRQQDPNRVRLGRQNCNRLRQGSCRDAFLVRGLQNRCLRFARQLLLFGAVFSLANHGINKIIALFFQFGPRFGTSATCFSGA